MTPPEEARVPTPRPLQPPPSSRSLGLFLQAGAPAPLPGFPRGGISRPFPPHPSTPASQATSGPCPSAALGPGAGPRQARGVSRRTHASATAGLPPSFPVPAPAAVRPSSPPPAQPAAPSPPTRTLRLAAGAPGLGPRWREGFAGRAGASEPRGREAAPRAPPPRPPPRPTVPPPAPSLLLSLLPPSQRHPRTAGPPRPPSLPRAADVAERPGAGRPRQGSPRPVSLAPGPPPAPALPLARPPLSPDRRNPQPEPVSPAAEVGSPPGSRREDADRAGDLPAVRGRGARGSPPPPASTPRPGPL